MKREETEGLFRLLAIYFPGERRLRDEKLKAAWHLVLEPYGADEVRRALAGHLRSSRYFPYVQELALRCAPRPPEEPPEPPPGPAEDRAAGQAAEYRRALTGELERRGLDPFPPDGGGSYARWREGCLAAGVDLAELAERAVRGTG